MKMATMSAAALILILVAGPAVAIEPNSSCQALDAWASQLATLPADYESFMALEPGQRRAVYQKLSHGERAALWQRQLREALAEDGWNDRQRSLIAETAGLMTAESFAARSGGEAFEDLERRVAAEFPRQQALALFFNLGVQSLPDGRSGLIPLCSCSLIDQDCSIGQSCQPRNCSWGEGCGFTGQEFCDGVCRNAQ